MAPIAGVRRAFALLALFATFFACATAQAQQQCYPWTAKIVNGFIALSKADGMTQLDAGNAAVAAFNAYASGPFDSGLCQGQPHSWAQDLKILSPSLGTVELWQNQIDRIGSVYACHSVRSDIDYVEFSQKWCPPAYQISLTGPSRTKALVAGPAIVQVAQVTATTGSVSGVAVNITIANGGGVAGVTDARGIFEFTYVPPYRATVDHLKATCDGCGNQAEKNITVDPCEVCAPSVGNPVQPASGEKLQTETDWVDSGVHSLTLARTYRSFGVPEPNFGLWSTPWSAAVVIATTEASVQLGDGQRILFRRAAAGEPWVADGSADGLSETAEGSRYRRAADGAVYVFDAAGRLGAITERNGWVMGIQRDGTGRIAAVTNAFGRSLAFVYDTAGRIAAATLPDGSRIAYGYDAASRLTSVTYPDASTRAYLYESQAFPGAMTGIVDERGVRVATFAYDAFGRATSTEHAGAQAFGASYSQSTGLRGQLVRGTSVDASIYRAQASITDPLGTARTYEWVGGDGRAYLAGANASGGIAGYTSRAGAGLPLHETDFMGVTTTYVWDGVRRLKTATTEAAGRAEARTTTTEWHPAFDLPLRVTDAGRVTEYTYDALGNKVSQTVSDTASGQARTWRWEYAQGLTISATDPRGAIWKYGYDATGNRISQTDPLGNATTFAFDAAGRMTSRTEPGGLQSTYAYDARGRVISQTSGGETMRFAYTPTGRLLRATLPNGYEVSYGYDVADRLVFVADNRGANILYVLDGAGNRVREEVKDANGNIVLASARIIDALGRVAASQGAQGQSTQYGYDANGARLTTTDPLNLTTRQTLDALGRTSATTFPDNTSAGQEWNALDTLTQVTDPKGVKTQYVTNAFGEVTGETSPDIGTTTYQRDATGNVIATTDARGVTARITRDALGRIFEVRYDDQVQGYAYDARGLLSRIDDGSGSVVYTHDALGRVLTKTQTVNDLASSPSKYAVQYGYTQGDLASVRYPSGLYVTYRRVAGRITHVDVLPPGKGKTTVAFASNLAHTALGQPRSWSWFNGDSASRAFDADGRMTSNEFASYGYDAAGRITSLAQQLWVNMGTQLERKTIGWTIGYDSRNRLTSMARGGQSTAFTYDANSNRLSKLEITSGELDLEGQFDAPGTSLTTSETPHVEASSNRLLGFSMFATVANGTLSSTSTSEVKYAVDAAGNMTSDGLRKFTYDASNRPSKVEAIRGGDAIAVEYLHNALGQRVFKSDAFVESIGSLDGKFGSGFIGWLKSNFGWLFAPGQSGRARSGLGFVYDEGGNLLGAYGNGSNASAQQQMEYIWLPQEDGSAIPIGAYKGSQLYAVHTDHLGTPRLITDAANKPTWQWPYSSFGNNKPTGALQTVTTTSPSGIATQLKATTPALEFNLRYPGQYCDSESYLCYNWWRYYGTAGGRYTQADPIGLNGGWNRYAYAEVAPTMEVDPLGLTTFMCTKPLHGLGEKWGQRLYPESSFNPSPFYHQYVCVPDGKGGMTCGGQDRAEGPFGPGKPSADSYSAESCKPVDQEQCVEQCLLSEINNPNRPPYALFGGGGRNLAGPANCQQWADRKLKSCQRQCKTK